MLCLDISSVVAMSGSGDPTNPLLLGSAVAHVPRWTFAWKIGAPLALVSTFALIATTSEGCSMPAQVWKSSCFDGQVAEWERNATRLDCPKSTLEGSFDELPRNATYINIPHSKFTGDVKELPRGATYLNINERMYSRSDVSGDVKEMPRGLTYISTNGGVSGNVNDIPRSATYIDLSQGALKGNCADLPRASTYINLGVDTDLTGDAKDLPRTAIYWEVGGWGSRLVGKVSDMPKGLDHCSFHSDAFDCKDLQNYGLCKTYCWGR